MTQQTNNKKYIFIRLLDTSRVIVRELLSTKKKDNSGQNVKVQTSLDGPRSNQIKISVSSIFLPEFPYSNIISGKIA